MNDYDHRVFYSNEGRNAPICDVDGVIGCTVIAVLFLVGSRLVARAGGGDAMNPKFRASGLKFPRTSGDAFRDAQYADPFEPPFKRYDDPVYGSPESWMSRTAAVVGWVAIAVCTVAAAWIIARAMGAPVGLLF
jgi:hypothetical protein